MYALPPIMWICPQPTEQWVEHQLSIFLSTCLHLHVPCLALSLHIHVHVPICIVETHFCTATSSPEPGRVSFQATPLPLRHLDREPFNRDVATRQGRGEKGQGEGEGDWHVELSRPPTQLEGPFSPLMFQAPPAIPRIMELDVTRKRYMYNHVSSTLL